jgi:hypothetical protein
MSKQHRESELSARAKRIAQNGKSMSKAKTTDPIDPVDPVDPLDRTFSLDMLQKMGTGVRGKYYARVSKGTNLVRLHPDIAKAFPSEDAVNAALASVIEMAKFTTKPRTTKRKTVF